MSYYAVKVGRETGIFNSWDQASELVTGYKGAVYKKFDSEQEAIKFLYDEIDESSILESDMNIDELRASLDEETVILITDGSYDKGINMYGYGIIILTKEFEDTFYNSGNDKRFRNGQNISGEVFGVLEGLSICKDQGFKKVYIYHDYVGLDSWASGDWNAKTPIAKYYVSELENFRDLELSFIKVKSHSGHSFNEKADMLAKQSLNKRGSKTYDDGTVYISGVEQSKISDIIEILQEIYEDDLYIDDKDDGYRKIYTVQYDNQKVVISYYTKNLALYIQGKTSKLFSNIIEKLVEQSENNNSITQVLNKVYNTEIRENKVEDEILKQLPNYENKNEENIDKIIYSSVYNSLVVGFKKDYSDLVHPTYRIQEYILHKILGDGMTLETEKDNGSNNFSYFSKNNGKYYCNKDTSCLNNDQELLLNDVYNYYATNRHPNSHTSKYDFETIVIEDIAVAKDLIKEGHKLFDRYCKHF